LCVSSSFAGSVRGFDIGPWWSNIVHFRAAVGLATKSSMGETGLLEDWMFLHGGERGVGIRFPAT
jgi:hypothetical protein